MNILLQPVTENDQHFLFDLYSSTRKQEIDGWGWDQKQIDTFLRMQFQAQNVGYLQQFPGAQYHIIVVDGTQAGRIVIWDSSTEIRLVDISLLQEFRSRGIGSYLIHDLQKLSASKMKPLRLAVLQSNRAQDLYTRLGFKFIGQAGFYLEMEWNPHR
jgi:ribosomal protein S18 acetylase RimI-like enzyme